ncbi:unnamed protein product [Amoebophrya sp. A25]|nr:unnamed protein product [Amoebophrya sp. A25]|eukprot:GSA25T00014128001.1
MEPEQGHSQTQTWSSSPGKAELSCEAMAHARALSGLAVIERKVAHGSCRHCWLTLSYCACSALHKELLTTARRGTKFVVFMDPLELRRSVGANTGKMLLLWGAELVVFGHTEHMRRLEQLCAAARRPPVCLFPTADAVPVPAFEGNGSRGTIVEDAADDHDGDRRNRANEMIDLQGPPDLIIIPDGDWRRCKVMLRCLPPRVHMWALRQEDKEKAEENNEVGPKEKAEEENEICGEAQETKEKAHEERGNVPKAETVREEEIEQEKRPTDVLFGRTKKYPLGPVARVQTAGAFWLLCSQMGQRFLSEGLLELMASDIQHLVSCYHRQINRTIVADGPQPHHFSSGREARRARINRRRAEQRRNIVPDVCSSPQRTLTTLNPPDRNVESRSSLSKKQQELMFESHGSGGA